jgi:hypothetical protein
MRKHRLLASVAFMRDNSPGGLVATAMRILANSAPTATGSTLISPDGTMQYISRAEAERFVNGTGAGEARQ